MNTRRWPPGERGSSLLRGQWTGQKFDDDQQGSRISRGAGPAPGVEAAIGDLRKELRAIAPTVLAGATYQVPTPAAPVSEQYRVPFEALAVISTSSQYLVLTADSAKQSGPPSGPGVAIIPPGGFVVFNTRAYNWTIYGGLAGDQLTVSAFTRPLPPNMTPGVVRLATGTAVSIAGAVFPGSEYPLGSAVVDNDSGVVGAAVATATLPAAAGKTTYCTGFEVTGAGATAASVITVTLTAGAVVKHYVLVIPAGVTASITPLVVEFTKAIQCSAANTAITISAPSFGAGNTAACVTAHGYQV